ncbi:MAG: FAD:protein FMN transferase [Burkholderiaceae bacterium]
MTANPRRQWLRTSLGIGAALAGAGVVSGQAATGPLDWRERTLLGFGTTLWLRAAHQDGSTVERALDAAVQAVRHVEAQMSLFDPASAVSRLNRDGVLHAPDADLLRVLQLARQVAARSAGAFDITVQPLWQAWALARRAGRTPTRHELSTARALVGWRGVEADSASVVLRRPGMAITLNGIAQGYAADLARRRLVAHGIEHALLDTGEWAPLGRGPGDLPWTLAVADPRGGAGGALHAVAALQARGRSVATSSDAHTAFTADLRHHHIFDPRSGESPGGLASVTVLAPSCALADALTKVMFMGNTADALALAAHWGVDVLAVDKAGRWQTSPGLVAA